MADLLSIDPTGEMQEEQLSFAIFFRIDKVEYNVAIKLIPEKEGIRDIYQCTIDGVKTIEIVMDNDGEWSDLDQGPTNFSKLIGAFIEYKTM